MANVVKRVIFRTELEGDDVKEELQVIQKESKATSDQFKEAWGSIDEMLGGVPTKLQKGAKGIGTFAKGLKSLRGAVIATGVGALLIAVTSLVSYFTKTKRGAELLEKATAGLGAVVGVLTDRASQLGELLVNAFQNPKQAITEFAESLKTYVMDQVKKIMDGFGLLGSSIKKLFSGDFSGALEDAKQGAASLGEGLIKLNPATAIVAKITEEVVAMAPAIKKAANAAYDLAAASQRLRESQRKLRVEVAEGRAAIKEYNLVAEDTNASIEDRIAAAEQAIQIEQGLMDQRLYNAAEELRIHKEQMALSESTEEDYERLADLEAAMATARMESLEMQTTLNNKLNTLRKEGQTIAEATLKAEQDALQLQYDAIMQLDAALATQQENEVMAVAAKYDNLLELADKYHYDEQELIDRQNAEIAAINKKYRDAEQKEADDAAKAEVARRQAQFQMQVQMAGNALGAIQALREAFGSKDEEQTKQQFKRTKALNMASAVIQTALAISAALTAGGNPLKLATGAQFVEAGIAAAMGAAQIATIARTEYQSGSSGAPAMPSAMSAATGNQQQAPQLDLSFLGGGSEGTMNRSYVLAQDVTNSQQAQQLVNDQANLMQ